MPGNPSLPSLAQDNPSTQTRRTFADLFDDQDAQADSHRNVGGVPGSGV